MAALDGADHNGEVLAACLGLAAIAASDLGPEAIGALATGADRAIGPAGSFKPSAGGGFV